MSAFFDATCTKCKRKFGWTGELKDKPCCPRCKHHDKITEEDEKEIEEFKQKLLKKSEQKLLED